MISVLMSIYNERIEWIIEAIDSILNQTYRDLELIIVIDNPDLNDDKRALVEGYRRDERVKLIYNPNNIGLANSMNIALAAANGDYIARMDADDISLPNRLERELDHLLNTGADLVSSIAYYIDESGEETGKSDTAIEDQTFEIEYSNRIFHPSVLGKISAFKDVGGYRDFRRAQDYDLWLRMVAFGKRIVVLNEYLIKYRRTNVQASTAHKLEQYHLSNYQRKLYRERLVKGEDSYTKEHLEDYLKSKKITPKKNAHCVQAFSNMQKASKSTNFIKKLFYVLCAWLTFPPVVTNTITRKLQKKLRARNR